MPDNDNPIDQDLIRTLAGLLDETGLSEIEIEQNGIRVRVARQLTANTVAVAPRQSEAAVPPPLAQAAAHADLSKHPGLVNSPMVGTRLSGSFLGHGQTEMLALLEDHMTVSRPWLPR